MVVKWTFEDVELLETYTFEVNPVEGGSPNYDKSVVYENTSAEDGNVIMMEGRDQVQKINWEGVILTQDQFETFVEWYDKRKQINVTDDLGRQFSIVITSFRPTRLRATHFPWRHRYTLESTIS